MMVVEKNSKTINKSFQFVADNRYFILSLLFLLLGLLIGTLVVGHVSDGYEKMLKSCFDSFISFRKESNFIRIFFSNFFTDFCLLSIVLFSSFGVVGIPAIPLIVSFKGFVSGLLSGVLYRYYSLHGIAFANLILLPADVIVFFALVYLSSKCFALSLKFFSLLRDISSKGVAVRPFCVTAMRKYLICIVFLTVSSIIETVLTVGFIKFFNFS